MWWLTGANYGVGTEHDSQAEAKAAAQHWADTGERPHRMNSRGASRTAATVGSRGRSPAIRAPPASSRPRRRDGTEGVPLPIIQRQLGHAHLGVTSTYLQGIDTTEIINTIHARRPPMIPASAGLIL
jgi:hypothetical protein